MPPLISFGYRFSKPLSPTISRARSATSSISSFESPLPMRASLTFSSAVIHGNVAMDWWIKDIFGVGSRTSSPWRRTRPLVGLTNIPRTLRSVDFPTPEGPTIETSSFLCVSTVTPSNIKRWPTENDRSRPWSTGGGAPIVRRLRAHS